MNNVRFSTAIHILTLLAYSREELLSSDYIAGSININPVLVRKEIINLRKHGLIESKEGKGGGSRLARAPKEIKISDIYRIVRQTGILGKTNDPNPACTVGRQINKQLEELSAIAERSVTDKLEQLTLEDFTKNFK
ncbi:Rrf2 family transcriptional regulator [Arcticibacter sp. MXS-1]|uniref:RrF2 family transcriptional regulator n=1 Tax=Arcticibacter sp. MXS-1 TaxID=3341726 RepID=UPI0035A933F0